jgi:hypothetical protein
MAYLNPVGRMPVNYAAGNSYENLRPKTTGGFGTKPAAAAMAAGPSPEQQSQAAWDQAMKLLLREGPYSKDVTQQLTNRQADQSAAAEAVNAEELRNSAAARGLSPNDPGIQAAMRQAQAQRQQSNIAFQGDIASQAAIQNFQATQPGYMAAAQANLNRQFGDQRQSAVQGGGMMMQRPTAAPQRQMTNTAFSGNQTVAPTVKPTVAPTPQKQPMSVADRNAAQAAWDKSTNYGRAVYGAGHQPGMSGTGRDAKGNLTGVFGTPKPDLKAAPPVVPLQGGYAGGRQYGSVQTFGY